MTPSLKNPMDRLPTRHLDETTPEAAESPVERGYRRRKSIRANRIKTPGTVPVDRNSLDPADLKKLDLDDSDRKDAASYVRLPESAATSEEVWRIQLHSMDSAHEPLFIEVCGDVFVGRTSVGLTADLDLTPYNGEDKGVSRQHALLRSAGSELTIADLGSTNGTYINGEQLAEGFVKAIANNDIISFGSLDFHLIIVQR